jgi:hypothetical protein
VIHWSTALPSIMPSLIAYLEQSLIFLFFSGRISSLVFPLDSTLRQEICVGGKRERERACPFPSKPMLRNQGHHATDLDSFLRENSDL